MEFYKVKKESDQTRFNESILVATELWTEKELKKVKGVTENFIDTNFDLVMVSKFRTYWCFGARFQNKLN